MDEIIIRNIKVRGKHGCFAAERETLCDFEVSLKLRFDFCRAAKTDELFDTIDYPSAMGIVEGVFSGESVRLIEKLADITAERLFIRFPVLEEAEIEVAKLGVEVGFDFERISAKITRKRNFYLKD